MGAQGGEICGPQLQQVPQMSISEKTPAQHPGRKPSLNLLTLQLRVAFCWITPLFMT